MTSCIRTRCLLECDGLNVVVVGVVLNLLMVDNATGQTLTKGIMMYNKIEKTKEEDNYKAGLHEESQQILKDIIREAGKQ